MCVLCCRLKSNNFFFWGGGERERERERERGGGGNDKGRKDLKDLEILSKKWTRQKKAKGEERRTERKYVTLHHEISRKVPDGHFHGCFFFFFFF